MRNLKILAHISLDGVIQTTGEDGFPYADWTAPYRSPEGLREVLAVQGERFDLLLGRRTYDMWSGYWPKMPAGPMANALNAATKHVVTHHPETLGWGPHAGVGPELVTGVRQLKAQAGANLILWGSSTLTSPLLEHGLVDELVLITYPVLVGAGKRFFAAGTPGQALELVSSKALASGIILSSYKPAKPLQKA